MFQLSLITAKQFSQLLCCILFCNTIFAQTNLVPNPSFEQYTSCPDWTSDSAYRTSKPEIWYKPDGRGAAYFNSCASNTNGGIPTHLLVGGSGYQYARTGNAYVGMYYLHGNSNNYFQVKLLDSLKPNKPYYAECYVNLTNVSNWASNNQGMLFTKKAVYVDTANYTFMLANAQVENKYIIQDTVNWVKVSGVFKAQGGEQYLTLGNFKLANATQKITIQTTGNYAAAYYVDDVAVYNLDSFCLKADAGRDTTIKVGDSVFIGSYTNGIDTLMWLQNGITKYDSTRPGFWYTPQATGTSFFILQQTVNGCYSSDTVYINAVLPLNFISYNLVPSLRGTKQSVENIWQTATEVNVNHYNIERSVNAKDFTAVGTLKANNKQQNNYTYTDELTPNTQPQTLFYRIQSIDNDGKKQYSTTQQITIKPQTLNSINIYPNPAKDFINLESTQGLKEIKIISHLGQTVQQLNNVTQHQTLNTKQLTKGLYIVQVTLQNGTIQNQKIIIQ